MDIQAKITEVAQKITANKTLLEQFKKEPVKAVQSVIGVDLPKDTLDKIVAAVKTKLSADKLGDIAGTLKKLF